ncbi:Lsr2 family DNA-binding protein [Streptomyces cinereoruber]|uniref:Lsr2 family DNA-binding protein n=1 Tax=Streptomyces cinereoruber TaxID=67260 RepID=UPI003C2F80B3
MFTDLTVSTQAGAFALAPSTEPQLAAAARTVARHARDEADLALLLDVLGLSADESTATDPFPETGDPATMTNTTSDAGSVLAERESTALSMHAAGAASLAPVIDVPVVPLPGSDPLQGLIEWAAATALTLIRTSTTYSRDELAAIRTWTRTNGHPIADRGLPSRTILAAYAAAHPATPARKAG